MLYERKSHKQNDRHLDKINTVHMGATPERHSWLFMIGILTLTFYLTVILLLFLFLNVINELKDKIQNKHLIETPYFEKYNN